MPMSAGEEFDHLFATANGARPDNSALAETLAKRGLLIFPAKVAFNETKNKWEKAPLIKDWQKQATTELERLAKWWREWPDAVPGIELGRAGLVVIDCDRHTGGKDGLTHFDNLVAQHTALPDHPIAPTAGGGTHHYFRQPPGTPFTNSAGDLKDTGVDVRGAGGWTVAPGSWRADGKRWGVAGLGPAFAKDSIPVLPEWLGEIIRPPKRTQEKQKHNGAGARQSQDDIPDLAVLEELLRYIPNNDRDNWRTVGMAINDAYGDAGRAVWARWSATSNKYDAADQDKNWRSFTPGGGITIASVIYLAKQGGWQPSRKTRPGGDKTKTAKIANTAQAADNDEELPPEAEDAIALVFAERHAKELRFVNAWGRWLSFNGALWINDNTLHTFDRVRVICREIAASGDKPSRAVASAKTVVAVERLARADRRLAASAEQWDDNAWTLNGRETDGDDEPALRR
jgi:Bifunctional DNA primase/polymerase, N-terminal/Primase C terminal 2 (PriCT-2)